MAEQVDINSLLCKFIQGRCENVIEIIPDSSIDLTLTSPPYDNLREYNSIFDFKKLAQNLFRVTKNGGVVVWNVMDAVLNGSETGTSFKQALYFMECGFNLHDTMIYEKNSPAYSSSETDNRYSGIFEYMFVFSKGKPKTANLICDKKNKFAGAELFGKKGSSQEGKIVKDFSPRTNIWRYVTSSGTETGGHTAVFPEQLAEDHIKTWSNQGDIVLETFSGSGTTACMASRLMRNWIAIELDPHWVSHAKKRLTKHSSMFGYGLNEVDDNGGYFNLDDL